MYEQSLKLFGLPLLAWIPLLPLIGAAFNLTVGRKFSRRVVHLVGCGTVAVACLVVLKAFFSHLYPLYHAAHAAQSEEVPRLVNTVWQWIVAGDVDIKLGLWFDPLTAVMTFVVTFVGFLIHFYSMGYMSHERDYARFFGYLNLFTGAMLLLVMGDNLVVLFVGWEGVGVCSYLLIGFWYDKDGTEKAGDANATAGQKAFIVNRIGDFAFILGMFVLFYFTGTLNIHEISQKTDALLTTWNAFGITTVTVAGSAAILLLIGATGKSAQIPLYVWLPDAMAGPTPVSALIHAATMVTAGVYMVARLNFVYMLSPTAMGVVALVGAFTALFAATIGFAQNDIKKVLAYSTISQLGYMFLAVGVGAYAAGIFHLFTHAFFKACLFLCAGSVIHAMSGRQDIREMGGLRKVMPHTHWTFLFSTLAIAGIPLFSGFFSKDEILWKAISQGNPAWPAWLPTLLYVVGMLGAMCTAFYMFRLYYLTFSGESRAEPEVKHHMHESPASMTGPLIVLAVGAAVLGFLGLPGVIAHGGYNVFHHWLEPVMSRGGALAEAHGLVAVGANQVAHNATIEWALIGVSVFVALFAWLVLARRLYLGGYSASVEKLVAGWPRLHKVVYNKYYVDEIYRAIFVGPLRWLARLLSDAFDKFLIDFVVVNGSAKLVDIGGIILRGLQSGNVQRYIVGVVVGAAAILYLFAGPVIEIQVTSEGKAVKVVEKGKEVQFTARVAGSTGTSHEYKWDFGDGSEESAWQASPAASHTYKDKKRYKVKLKVRDKRWKRVEEDTKNVEVR
jgi:NADH-quinone oxidoreductase subunit L